MRLATDLAYVAMVVSAVAGIAEIVWLRVRKSLRNLEPHRLSRPFPLDPPVVGDALDQRQPPATLRIEASPPRRHGGRIVIADLHPDARRELCELEAYVRSGMKHRVRHELVGEKNRDLDQLQTLP